MNMKAFAAAALLATAPVAASAVTVVDETVMVNEMMSFANVEMPGAVDSDWKFTADGAMRISFSVSGTGAATDLGKIEWSVDGTPISGFTTISGMMPAFGGALLGTYELMDGDMITVMADSTMDIGGTTGLTVSYVTTVVPLPAAGWMFLSALAGMGFLARKRSAA